MGILSWIADQELENLWRTNDIEPLITQFDGIMDAKLQLSFRFRNGSEIRDAKDSIVKMSAMYQVKDSWWRKHKHHYPQINTNPLPADGPRINT
jgi:hypothetical protein